MAARVPTKHSRDQAHQDFEGLLNNLQDWELSFKDKDKRQKSQSLGKEKLDARPQGHTKVSQLSNSSRAGEKPAVRRSANAHNAVSSNQHDYLREYNALSRLSSGLMTEDSSVDANSERELKLRIVTNCSSLSKQGYGLYKNQKEAESDCTEALNLDDRYTKAYSRRSTARKELGKVKESFEDAEFALKLEPQNQELKKQYEEARSLFEEEILNKASKASTSSVHGVRKAGKPKVEMNKSVAGDQSVPSNSNSKMVAEIHNDHIKGTGASIPSKTSMGHDGSTTLTKHQNGAVQSFSLDASKKNRAKGKQELKPSVQELAARAATLAMGEAAKNISPPNSAYQFEVSWRSLSGERNLQARLLKLLSSCITVLLSLSGQPHLLHYHRFLKMRCRCIGSFFTEDVDLSVKYLQNLTRIPRFDMIIMCLSSADKAELAKMWNETFSNTTPQYGEIIGHLGQKYRIQD